MKFSRVSDHIQVKGRTEVERALAQWAHGHEQAGPLRTLRKDTGQTLTAPGIFS